MISRNDACWCGSGKKWKKCHYPSSAPFTDVDVKKEYYNQYKIVLKDEHQIKKIEEACQLTAYILDELCKQAKEGVTTNELDQLSIKLHKQAHAKPAPLNYGNPPFTKTICTSLNEVVCHGIPDDRPLQQGDIMNIDVSSILDGYYGDCSRMVTIGQIDEEKKRVVDTSYQCLMDAIAICKPGVKIFEIAEVIEAIAKKNHCTVVYQFVGHGVGLAFHEPPQVPFHYNDYSIPMAPGMIFTIEPMINAGVAEAVIDSKDKWTARTVDGRPSAQWEHTILITPSGHKILTLPPNA